MVRLYALIVALNLAIPASAVTITPADPEPILTIEVSQCKRMQSNPNRTDEFDGQLEIRNSESGAISAKIVPGFFAQFRGIQNTSIKVSDLQMIQPSMNIAGTTAYEDEALILRPNSIWFKKIIGSESSSKMIDISCRINQPLKDSDMRSLFDRVHRERCSACE